MDFHLDIMKLKEELLNEIKKVDTKFTDLLKKDEIKIDEEALSPLNKINLMLNRTQEMFNLINQQKIKLDKITELVAFKNKVNDIVLSHEIRIKSIVKDLDDIRFKYDREISQNLTVPGYIGVSCRFKNISEFLLFNIDEITKLKMEKDLMKKDEKELKSKIESMIKNTLVLVDNSVKRSNSYTDNKQKNFENLLENKYREFNEKIMEMKTLSLSNEKFIKQELIKMTKLSSELTYIKDNVEKVFESKNNELKMNLNELKNKIDKINNEVKKNHKNLDNINNYMNNLNFPDNININDRSKIKTISNKTMRKSELINFDNNNNARKNQIYKTIKEDNIYIKENSNSKHRNGSNSFKKKISLEKIDQFKNSRNIENKNFIDFNEYNKKFSTTNEDSQKTNQLIKKLSKEEQISKFSFIKNKKFDNNNNILRKLNSNTIEGKVQREKVKFNLNNKLNDEINKEKTIEINDKYNLSDDEKEKKKLNSFDKNENKKNKKNKYKYIKINIQKSDTKNNNNNNNNNEETEKENNIMTYTDFNFYNKNELNDFHIYKDEIYNLKRYPLHKRHKRNNKNYKKGILIKINDTSEESSKRANSDFKCEADINDNSSNQLVNQKINTIYYPNEQMIKNFKNKDYFFRQFLNRHNNIRKNIGIKSPEKLINDDNYKIYEVMSNFNDYNISNASDKINVPPPLIKNTDYSNSKRNIKSELLSDKVNFKFISIDNQFKMALKKRKYSLRNNPELILSTPITNAFKTFQTKKIKI